MKVLVYGLARSGVAAALEEAGEDEDVIVLDPSAARLDEARQAFPDSRLWLAIGDPDVIPLPDGSVDSVVGDVPPDELRRVLR